MQKSSIALFANAILATAVSLPASAGGERAASVPKIVAACESCHGPGGNSSSSTVPKLNGQRADYITARLNAFLNPNSQTPGATHAMWDISEHVRPEDVGGIAKYFSSQIPTPSGNGGQHVAEGRKIYMEGDGARIPACAACHGPQGEGRGEVPRLAGQHKTYLAFQLESFNMRTRYHDKMDRNTLHMSDDEINAVSEYLADK